MQWTAAIWNLDYFVICAGDITIITLNVCDEIEQKQYKRDSDCIFSKLLHNLKCARELINQQNQLIPCVYSR